MIPIHKLNFLAKTYQPKYETSSSLFFSLVCYFITIFFTIYTCYSELLSRKISNIAYMGMHKNEKVLFNETIKVDLKFDIPFYCEYFYVTSENDRKVYFSQNNTSINQTISLIKRNSDGNFYYLKLYANCRIDKLRSVFKDILYNVSLRYDVHRANYLNPNIPFTKEIVSRKYFVSLGDKNEKMESDFDNYNSLKMNELKFEYLYYKILDDINWIQSDYNKEQYIHNLDRVIRTESYKSPPTENKENLLFFKFIVDHNDSEVLLIYRKFIKLPEISSRILGIFSLLKILSKILLKFAYRHSDKIHLINSIFKTHEFKPENENVKVNLINIPSKKLNEGFGADTLNGENTKKKAKKFNYFDNVKFCCIFKTRKVKLEYKMIKSIFDKLNESSNLPNLFLSLFLIKSNYNLCYQPKLNIYHEEEKFFIKFKMFDGSTEVLQNINPNYGERIDNINNI